MNRENTITKKKARTWKIAMTILFLCMATVVNDKMPAGTVRAAGYIEDEEEDYEQEGDYAYKVNEDGKTVTIVRYSGHDKKLTVPGTLGGKTVTGIEWDPEDSMDDEIDEDEWGGVVGCTSITLPNSVTTIGEYAFSHCEKLTSITLSSNLTSIGNNAFSFCRSLTSITLPSSLTSIGKGVFSHSGLTSITIPSSITSIGDYAFTYSDLTSITIPSSVTSIGDMAFTGISLTSIQVNSDNPKYDSRNNCNAIIDTKTNTLIAGCKNTSIPKGVTSIGYCAFMGSGLSNITIPEGVTSIGNSAFANCVSLTSITIPEGVTSIGDHTFHQCNNLTSITLPSGLTSIGPCAFESCGLTSIIIPSSVTSIDDEAFWDCHNLKSITIPSSVTSIGYGVFDHCPDDMIVYADAGSVAAKYAETYGFTVKPIGNTSTTPPGSGDTTPPSSGDTTPTDTPPTPAASGTVLNVSNSQCKVKVVSSDATNPTVTYTGTTNKKASTVTVPATVTVDNITYKVTGIAASAFKNNKKIKKVTIGANVTTIGKNAFYGCKKLKTITIKTPNLTSKTVGSKAFKGIDSKATIKVPKSKLASYKKLFKAKGVGSKVKIKK